MPQPAVIVLVVVLYLGRLVALHRLGRTHPAYGWIAMAPTLLVPAGLIWISIVTLPTTPILALVFAVLGIAYGAVVIRLVRGYTRAIGMPSGMDAWFDATFSRAAEVMLIIIGVGLVAALVGAVVLVVWLIAGGH